MSSLVLINGEEEFLIDRAAHEAARDALATEILEFEFPDGLEAYLSASQSSGFSTVARSYILWDVKEIPSLPSSEDETVVVVSKKPLVDARAKRTFAFPKLKTFEDNNEVIRWILKEGESFNIDLSRVAGALFVNSGSCLRKLASEIAKLASSVPTGTVVSPEQARPLMCFSAELTPREIIDAICDGHTAKALAFYDKMQERAEETGWIIAYMQRHVLQQLKLEKLIDLKTPEDQIISALGVHPFVYRKVIRSRRGKWSKESLLSGVETLCELDLAHKHGSEFARFGLQLEIIRLCEEVKTNVKRSGG